jgi:hypothetical protein
MSICLGSEVSEGLSLVNPLALTKTWFTSTLPRRREDIGGGDFVPKRSERKLPALIENRKPTKAL